MFINAVIHLQLNEEDIRNKNSDLEFLVNETNEREIQSTQSLNVLQTKLKELESALNQAQNESDSQVVTLNEELLKKEAEVQSLKEELKAKDAVNSDVEFQIKKYVCIFACQSSEFLTAPDNDILIEFQRYCNFHFRIYFVIFEVSLLLYKYWFLQPAIRKYFDLAVFFCCFELC